MSVAPAPSRYLKWAFSPTCSEPSNIMCSKRWAKPVRPGRSLSGPTWYQRSTATRGRRWSSCRRTTSPLGMVYFSYFSSGTFKGFAAGRLSAALAMGAMAKPHRSAAAVTHLVTNTGAFICSPQKLSEGLEECLRTRIGIDCEDDTNWMEDLARRFVYSLHAYASFFLCSGCDGRCLFVYQCQNGECSGWVSGCFGFI